MRPSPSVAPSGMVPPAILLMLVPEVANCDENTGPSSSLSSTSHWTPSSFDVSSDTSAMIASI